MSHSEIVNKKGWVKGSPVEVFSQSLSKWCPGEIVAITTDTEGECLELRYWDASSSKAKYLDPTSEDIRPIENPQSETRYTWSVGSEVECWSNSRQRWFDAEIIDVARDSDGEWLKLSWEDRENSTMTKEVLRSSLFVRPRYPNSNANNIDNNINYSQPPIRRGSIIGPPRNKLKQLDKLPAWDEKVSSYENEIEELKEELIQVRTELEDDRIASDRLIEELDKKDLIISRLKDQINKLQRDGGDSNSKQDQTISPLSSLSSLSFTPQMNNQVQTLKESLQKERSAKEKCESDIRSFRHQITDLEEHNIRLQQEVEKLRDELHEKENEYSNMQLKMLDDSKEIKDLTEIHREQVEKLREDNKKLLKKSEQDTKYRLRAEGECYQYQKQIQSLRLQLRKEQFRLRKRLQQNMKLKSSIQTIKASIREANDSEVSGRISSFHTKRVKSVTSYSTTTPKLRELSLLIDDLAQMAKKFSYSDEELDFEMDDMNINQNEGYDGPAPPGQPYSRYPPQSHRPTIIEDYTPGYQHKNSASYSSDSANDVVYSHQPTPLQGYVDGTCEIPIHIRSISSDEPMMEGHHPRKITHDIPMTLERPHSIGSQHNLNVEDYVKVKWPRRSGVVARKRTYDMTRISLSSEGITIQSNKSQQRLTWKWEQLEGTYVDGQQVTIKFDDDYIKMKLNDIGQAKNWQRCLEERRTIASQQKVIRE